MPEDRSSSPFRDLHRQAGAFIIPNPWDVGSAKILAAMGFQALATTSAGFAFSRGMKDGGVASAEMLEHCASIVAATPLPVSADLEKGFGDSPEDAAHTIRQAAGTGLAGASLEDFSGDPSRPIFDFGLAVERIAAASEAARGLGRDFVLTARSENFLRGNPDLNDTIKRLQAFEAAGADVLYAPALRDLDQLRVVCAAVAKPVNVLVTASFGLAELEAAGAKRLSIGSGLARLAYGSLIQAATEMRATESFTFLRNAGSFAEIEGNF